ncbi:acyl-CoA reductase [Sphingomonas sp.]|uniref:acyl-CoA reductase n=1 Tax=Sphingomonas sp. TaxID=28214 RepID=UPI003CC67E35
MATLFKMNEDLEVAPAIIRGKVITSDLMRFGGRGGDLEFLAPDPATIVNRLPLGNPNLMTDLYDLSVDDILDYLVELGKLLDIEKNQHLQAAFDLTLQTASQTASLLRYGFSRMPGLFVREELEDMVAQIGRDYLDGWVETRTTARGAKRYVRAFGARALHIVAGNSPVLSAVTIIRNAVARGDAIIKAPSNDPFTGIAVARTMIDFAPDHPITKHVSIAYWKGGDEAFESKLYQPHSVEKIVAWGGFASVKHVAKYIQPGLELISLDPKRSISIIGPEAFESEEAMDDVAQRVSSDFGGQNQEVCASARIVYVLSGSDEDGVGKAENLAERAYEKLLDLPDHLSTKPKNGINRELLSSLDAASFMDDFYTVVGTRDGEGGVIVSKMPEPVDFAPSLTNRVANFVPVDSIDDVLPRIDSYCQTIGIYPDRFIAEIADRLALAGGQRLVTLGHAAGSLTGFGSPQDGIEPIRRLCKWIFREEAEPGVTPWLWSPNNQAAR